MAANGLRAKGFDFFHSSVEQEMEAYNQLPKWVRDRVKDLPVNASCRFMVLNFAKTAYGPYLDALEREFYKLNGLQDYELNKMEKGDDK